MTPLDHSFLDRFALLDASDDNPNGSPPAAKLAKLVRPAIVARPGKVLAWCDWSAIEARVLPWLAASRGAEKMLDVFRANDADPTAPDVYMIEAGGLLGKDPRDVTKSERQSHGKVPVLSLGFGGGLGALQAMATNYGVYLDPVAGQAMVDSWRDRNRWAVHFWGKHNRNESYGLWGAACSALEDPDTPYPVGRVVYVYDRSYLGGTLFCAMPCGRLLTYPAIKWEMREVEDRKTKKLVERMQMTYRKGYGRAALWHGKCLAGDTLALTRRGWTPITEVTLYDLLWDGVEWVAHDGLSFNGERYTVPIDGVHMTPDHEVLTNDGWKEASQLDGSDRATVRLPVGFTSGPVARPQEERAVGREVRLRGREDGVERRMDAQKQTYVAGVMRLPDSAHNERGALYARHDKTSHVLGVEIDDRSLPTALKSCVAQLRWTRNHSMRALGWLVRKFLGRHGGDVPAWLTVGAQRQRQRLLARELRMGDVEGAMSQSPEQSVHRNAMGPNGSQRRKRAQRYWCDHATVSAGEQLAGREAVREAELHEPVFDIVNAGPRRRFTVLGTNGPFIVHNCAEGPTQALAASILRHTLVALEAEVDWMPVIGSTHDEVVVEVDEADEQDARNVIHEYFVDGFDWTDGLPLAAEVSSNLYYTKAALK